MTHYLNEDNPELWEKVKDHVLDWKDCHDWGEDMDSLICIKCGKKAIMIDNMTWVCPINRDIPTKYFHSG